MAFMSTIIMNCGQNLATKTPWPWRLSCHLPKHLPTLLRSHIVNYVEKVRQRLVRFGSGNAFKDLIMIDHIQRLGIDHLFRDEIRRAMERQSVEWYSDDRNAWCSRRSHDRLHESALRFRLLRQQGYHVSPDIFNKFRDKKGKFEEGLGNNIEGLMSLFEASQMSIEGEDILEEANAFTIEKLLENLHKPHHVNKIAKIKTVLKLPYHKSLAKFTAMDFLHSFDHSSQSWLSELGELAKMDFEMATLTYKHEFLRFSRWWKEVGLAEDLKMARDEPLKWYIWAVAAQPDPNFSEERLDIAKPISLVYVVDDLFDVYGELDHLFLFTQAINRWDLATVGELPEYMQSTWRAIFDTTNDISHKIWIKHGWNPINSLKKVWADFCNACLMEAQWNASGYSPTTSEYLNMAIITSGVPMILCHGFFLLAETLDSRAVQLLDDDPKIVSSVATILRLSDDLGSAKDEGQNGYDGSYMKWYMKENDDVSMDATRGRVDRMIKDAWKDLNKESLHTEQQYPFSASHSFGRACLNSARMVPLMYTYEHGHLPGLRKFLELLLHGN